MQAKPLAPKGSRQEWQMGEKTRDLLVPNTISSKSTTLFLPSTKTKGSGKWDSEHNGSFLQPYMDYMGPKPRTVGSGIWGLGRFSECLSGESSISSRGG